MRIPILFGTILTTMVAGIQVGHAESAVDQVQRFLGNGSSDRNEQNAYERGREDEQYRQQVQHERRREERQERSAEPYGRETYYGNQPYGRQQRGS